ncbi:hypothetical protein [Amycolatopsis nalaikhensis]|uniref:Integral membrane protein n=1 Tax=Amycolatopsis nalaikhensis TaxID=715472 RepID=A0ABY8XTQ9_9PSEU|nr:hypothetical protein [Amycolatopsis sp. 2-2]WIV59074.1 hypothetical protein QP939_10780 [Amycolatopsis sp. 2-2]
MSAGEVAVRAVIGAVAGAAVVAALVPYLRHVRRDRARFLDEQQSTKPRNGRKPEGMSGDPLEFVAGAGSVPPGLSHPPRSNAATARRKVANTGEVFARAAASIPERNRVIVWRELTEESRPFRIAYRWATSFGKLFTLGMLFFAGSVVALFGDYSPFFLFATLTVSAILVGLPAVKLHRIAWQALNLSAGVYVVALKGEDHVDE